ncbi:hypothetical protein UT300007_36470 [Clostridium sp. CTA-7]
MHKTILILNDIINLVAERCDKTSQKNFEKKLLTIRKTNDIIIKSLEGDEENGL